MNEREEKIDKVIKIFDNDKKKLIKRLDSPEKLRNFPLYYNLLKDAGVEQPSTSWERMIYILSFIENNNDKTIGKTFAESKTKDELERWENRICYFLRLSYPKDIIQLRRMIVHAEVKSLNKFKLCETLYYWNKKNKQKILEDFVFAKK
ncbi:MAG: hypothetical protein LBQ13_00310 [Endomicrobium sp.]|jgi:CRISPR system Cascade subunit CasB|nr:hypothetical protein [Endomicrobium sp.]